MFSLSDAQIKVLLYVREFRIHSTNMLSGRNTHLSIMVAKAKQNRLGQTCSQKSRFQKVP